MNDQKKQKVILALVVALVLGAGTSFWYLRSDSGSGAQKTGNTGPTVRRERDTTGQKGKSRNKRRARKKEDKAPVKVRATREVTEKKKKSRKTRGRSTKKIKKKKTSPAA